ncbi:hypothetical protein D4764_07G0002650, partial [Takifugu flavidus]
APVWRRSVAPPAAPGAGGGSGGSRAEPSTHASFDRQLLLSTSDWKPRAPCTEPCARSASPGGPCMHQQHPPSSPAGMEQEPGVAGFIPLNEHEQRYYSGLHSLCQADASGKLSSGKVAELFKASQLPPESLHKVSPAAHLRLCGWRRPAARHPDPRTGTTRIMLRIGILDRGHEPIFPAEKSAAGVTVPRGLLPGYRSPLSLCVVVRKLGTEPPLPSCPGLDGRHGAGLIDTQLSEALGSAAGCLQDRSRTEAWRPGSPCQTGSEEHQRQVSSVVMEEGFVTNALSLTLCGGITRRD